MHTPTPTTTTTSPPQVDFQFYDPADKDYHGLKALLATYLDGRPYEASALVDTLVAQVGWRRGEGGEGGRGRGSECVGGGEGE